MESIIGHFLPCRQVFRFVPMKFLILELYFRPSMRKKVCTKRNSKMIQDIYLQQIAVGGLA